MQAGQIGAAGIVDRGDIEEIAGQGDGLALNGGVAVGEAVVVVGIQGIAVHQRRYVQVAHGIQTILDRALQGVGAIAGDQGHHVVAPGGGVDIVGHLDDVRWVEEFPLIDGISRVGERGEFADHGFQANGGRGIRREVHPPDLATGIAHVEPVDGAVGIGVEHGDVRRDRIGHFRHHHALVATVIRGAYPEEPRSGLGIHHVDGVAEAIGAEGRVLYVIVAGGKDQHGLEHAGAGDGGAHAHLHDFRPRPGLAQARESRTVAVDAPQERRRNVGGARCHRNSRRSATRWACRRCRTCDPPWDWRAGFAAAA